MVNYYEELSIQESNTIGEIKGILNQLELTWRRREINSPEKATKMLALIQDARGVFQTESTRIQYDSDLEKCKETTSVIDANEARRNEFEKWRDRANEYYVEGGQLDLAIEAMHKALQFRDSSSQDHSFSWLCSLLYQEIGDSASALSYINEAIVNDPEKAAYYFLKAHILGELFNAAIEKPDGFETARSYLSQNRANYEKALKLYREEGDIANQILCLEGLGESYSLMYDSDFDKAEKYIKDAISLGDNKKEVHELLDGIRSSKQEFQPYQGKGHPSTKTREGCYIATSIYGSYDCPEVWTLRRYRDMSLKKTALGRIVVKVYYRFSPRFVILLKDTDWLKCTIKALLDKKVEHLIKQGYSSDKYSD